MQSVNTQPRNQAQFHRERPLSVGQSARQGYGAAQTHHNQRKARRNACMAHPSDDNRRPVVARTDQRGTGQRRHLCFNPDHIQADKSGELRCNCRHPNFRRRPTAERKPTKATNIANRTSIPDRPAEADGKRFGDFEMDLIVDAYGHAILVLVERMTNFAMMEKLPHGKKAASLA